MNNIEQQKSCIRVVLIEDDADDVLLIRSYLREIQGLQVELQVCAGADEGWQCIQEQSADVYLIDHLLGADTGVSLIKRARLQGVQKPLILLTGADNQQIDAQAESAGATDYVLKDALTPALLSRVIRYSLAQWQVLISREQYLRERMARKQAQQLERRKDEFLKVVSHELKSPLTSALSVAYLLDDYLQTAGRSPVQLAAQPSGQRDTQVLEYTKRITRQLRQLARLVEDLLDASKIEFEALSFNPEVVDVIALVREHVRDMQLVCLHELRVVTSCNELYVAIDPWRFRQLLTNIVRNGIVYSPDGTPVVITITARRGSFELSVQDWGIGIPADKLEGVFEKFSRVAHGPASGLGIGLFLCRHIVRQHGGTISLESTLGSGTIARVSLPRYATSM